MRKSGYLAGLLAGTALAGGVDIRLDYQGKQVEQARYEDLCGEEEKGPAIQFVYNRDQMDKQERALFDGPHTKIINEEFRYGGATTHSSSVVIEAGPIRPNQFDMNVDNPFVKDNARCDHLHDADEFIITMTAYNREITRKYQKKFEVKK